MLADTMIIDPFTANVSNTDRTLLNYAQKLTHDPQNMLPSDLETLHELELTDRTIHDATQVIALFNYYNRIADELSLSPEEHPSKD